MDRMLIARAATLALILILTMTFLRLSSLFLSTLDFTFNFPNLNNTLPERREAITSSVVRELILLFNKSNYLLINHSTSNTFTINATAKQATSSRRFADKLSKRVCLRGKIADEPLFVVFDADKMYYFRIQTYSKYIYNDGWESEELPSIPYEPGDRIPINAYLGRPHIDSVTVIPLITLAGKEVPVPIVKYTRTVQGVNSSTYYPEGIYLTTSGALGKYTIEIEKPEYDENYLKTLRTLAKNPTYLEVPSKLKPYLQKILNKIKPSGSEYDRIIQTIKFLVSNYKYDKNFTPAPPNVDPVIWFLFKEKRGVCVHFNTALTLLLRMQKIPARLVTGFMAGGSKVSYVENLHAWTEVYFEKVGWIDFDATPGKSSCNCLQREPAKERAKERKLIPTVINITSIYPNVQLKGRNITVKGYLRDTTGKGLDNKTVEIRLKVNKTSEGILIGLGKTRNGFFEITCTIPKSIDVGTYEVVAIFRGDEVYRESESDPPLTVIASTQIRCGIPRLLFTNTTYNFLCYLLDSDGKGLNGSPVHISIMRDNSKLNQTARTNSSGAFTFKWTPTAYGSYNVSITFKGSKYYLPARYEQKVNVVSVDVTPRYFIRGVEANVKITIKGCSENHCDNLTVIIGDTVKKYEHAKGEISLKTLFNESWSGGEQDFLMIFNNAGVIYHELIHLYINTSIKLVKVERTGEGLIVAGRLVDSNYPDKGLGNLIVQVNTKNVETNSSGYFNVTFSEKEMASWNSTIITIKFHGKGFFLPSALTFDAKNILKPASADIYLLLMQSAPFIAAMFAVSYYLYNKQKKTSEKGLGKELQPLNAIIKIKEIPPAFPKIWCVKTPLTVEASCEDQKATIIINGQEKFLADKVSLEFPAAGKYEIKAICEDGRDEKIILEVYEPNMAVSRLYESVFLEWVRGMNVEVEEKTPYEIFLELKELGGEKLSEKAGKIKELTDIFNLAYYSSYSLSPKDFIAFYDALKSVVMEDE